MISFFVAGAPVTQGSKIAAVNRYTGRAVMREVNGSKLDHWRQAIRTEAQAAGEGQMYTGPVGMTLSFFMPKPASAPKRKRTWPIKARSGDADKLARAALDAVTHVLIHDDSQVVHLEVFKAWAEEQVPGVFVELRSMEGGPE